ncbi:MAG TPA: AGE family epimerase/isomerase [Pyrinomonadaceae bacterium]|nr:AGE family epimerase/isomerase [Pyrinomonadaceae bacterium]
MDRRAFINLTATGGIGLGGSIASFAQRKNGGAISTRSGLPLKNLAAQYRRDLFDDFLPFMEKYVIDHELGGFMCNADHTGRRENTNKLSWFEGRGSWVYAFLYNNLAREKKYLDIAHRSLELVLRSKPSSDVLWSKELTREGKPITPPDIEVYGDLFIAEGLSEFSKATGENSYWDQAKELVSKCVRIYDRPDYRPSIGQTYLGKDARTFPGARIQGVWMVLVRVITQMLEMRGDAELEKIAARCVDALMDHHFNPELRLNNELLNHDLSRPSNEYSQLVYTGHCIETLWMVLLEAKRLKSNKLFATAAERFRRHVDVAWDEVYGGVFRNLMNVDENRWTLDKVLWAQEEVLIGSLMVFEETGAAWAREMFERTNEYVRRTFPLQKHGSPIWMYAGNRRVEFEEFKTRPKRIENYHHPRHLMLNLLSVERMLKKMPVK